MKHPSTIAAELNEAMERNAPWYASWENRVDLYEWLLSQGRAHDGCRILRKAQQYGPEWREFEATRLARKRN